MGDAPDDDNDEICAPPPRFLRTKTIISTNSKISPMPPIIIPATTAQSGFDEVVALSFEA